MVSALSLFYFQHLLVMTDKQEQRNKQINKLKSKKQKLKTRKTSKVLIHSQHRLRLKKTKKKAHFADQARIFNEHVES